MTTRSNGNVTLLFWQQLQPCERNAAAVVQFYGGTISYIDVRTEFASFEKLLETQGSRSECVLIHASTIASAIEDSHGRSFIRLLMGLNAKIFLFGFEATSVHGSILSEITSQGIVGVESAPSNNSPFTVDSADPYAGRHFTGLSIGSEDPAFDRRFVIGTNPGAYSAVIRVDDDLFFIRTTTARSEFLLLACQEIADLDCLVRRGSSVVDYFSRLVPLLMFLFRTHGDRLWHNENPRACLVLDDPLLKPRYGFLDFNKLLSLMIEKRFCTSIAFIPWNYRRSKPSVVKLFASHSNRYSLSVHGCDHTLHEFGISDYQELRRQAALALSRMRAHEHLTQIGFDKVMVFPQGVFSIPSVRALKSSGYLAAINSTLYPIDLVPDSLRLRDLVDLAETTFYNFPLFRRRYPHDIQGIALDLFLGKQALLVEHHDYFRYGYADLARTVDWLAATDNRLQWSGLAALCSHSCLTRSAANGITEVKLYTDRFVLQNPTNLTRRHLLFRGNTGERSPVAVTANGKKVDFEIETNRLVIPMSLEAGQSIEIVIERDPQDVMATKDRTRIRVLVRRLLSEFRDDYVSKSIYFTKLATGFRRLLSGGK